MNQTSQPTNVNLTLDEIWREIKKCPKCKERFRDLVRKKLLDQQIKQLLPE